MLHKAQKKTIAEKRILIIKLVVQLIILNTCHVKPHYGSLTALVTGQKYHNGILKATKMRCKTVASVLKTEKRTKCVL